MPHRIIIVGAGLAGSLLAVQLGKAGHDVLLLERRGDPRSSGVLGGRSINLAISVRGFRALERAGLHDRILEDAVEMPGRMIHANSNAIFQPYSRDSKQSIKSVSRGGLNLALIEAADALDNVTILFDRPCTTVDLENATVTTTTPQGTEESHSGDLVVGADGAYSAVRLCMQMNPRFNYSQTYLEHGYKELTIAPVSSGEHAPFALEPNALHIWPHGGAMMIALPNPDGSFTCTLFWPYEGSHGFNGLENATGETILEFFSKEYPDATPIMPTLVEDYQGNPTSPLVTIRCDPWSIGRTVLLGDAAHAIVPFYGQGANAAFEDCDELADALARHPDDIDQAVQEFQDARLDNANAIADLAVDNFLEMRDHTGNRVHRVKKKGSQMLGGLFPGMWTPLYDMVSFTTIPYAKARKKARRQSNLAWLAGGLIILGCILLAVLIPMIFAGSSAE
ncbi:MAG: FAD-dependent monooxygenase [Phycisphaerales bacterium]|nr:FAD-dependent monooxygenase [Phycisphaerales bacterium]